MSLFTRIRNYIVAPLLLQGNLIMSEIKDFADFVEPKLDAIDTNVTNALNSITAVSGDVQFLKAELDKLQPISADDKARLETIKARVGQLDTNVSGVAGALKALDDQTPAA